LSPALAQLPSLFLVGNNLLLKYFHDFYEFISGIILRSNGIGICGAKEAKIGEFMKAIVSDCYEENDQKVFVEIFTKLDQAAEKKFSKIFLDLAPGDRQSLLIAIDQEANDHQKSKKADEPEHYFTLTKQLTLWGYFISEPGSTKALRYLPIPGGYEGCAPYKKGDKAWAQT